MSALTSVPEIILEEMDYEDFIHADAVMGQRFNSFYQVERSFADNDPQEAPQE